MDFGPLPYQGKTTSSHCELRFFRTHRLRAPWSTITPQAAR